MELRENWILNRDLANSYMELIYTTFIPKAMQNEDAKSVSYYEEKIKEYEEKYGAYPTPIIRLNNLNEEYKNGDISLRKYLEEMEFLIMRLKFAAEVLESEGI